MKTTKYIVTRNNPQKRQNLNLLMVQSNRNNYSNSRYQKKQNKNFTSPIFYLFRQFFLHANSEKEQVPSGLSVVVIPVFFFQMSFVYKLNFVSISLNLLQHIILLRLSQFIWFHCL